MPDHEGARPQRADPSVRRRITRAHYANLGALFDATTFRRIDALGIRERLLSAGLLTAAEIDRHLADLAAGRLDVATFTVVSAWGRKKP